MLVNPTTGSKAPAFDQVKLAAALNTAMAGMTPPRGMATPRHIDAMHLPVTGFTLGDGGVVTVMMGATTMRCDLSGTGVCTPMEINPGRRAGRPNQPPAGQSSTQVGGNAQMAERPAGNRGRAGAEVSPDKTKQAFSARLQPLGAGLWRRGRRTQLTTDGVKDYGYATQQRGVGRIRIRRSWCGLRIRRRSRRFSRTSVRRAICTWCR